MPGENQRFCTKCGKILNNTEFYQSNNKEKYPDGYMNECKKCMTMHVDNWDPKTLLPILEEVDVPWIPEEWNKLMYKFAQNASKVTGTTILGRYLSKMKLKQNKDYRWKDTEFLREMAEARIKQTMAAQGYEPAEIAAAVERGALDMPERPEGAPTSQSIEMGGVVYPHLTEEEQEDLDLTDEDVTYLKLKWGKLYKPEEWVRLEQLYNEMLESYDIQSAGHIDTLKLLCKTSLKCNQLIDIGDVEGYQKMSKVYDSLMKSGNFTAAQNKAETGEFVDSIGELVMLCEKDGYIERYYVSDPKDKVDETLMDMKRYTKTLVSEETNLNQLLEQAIKMNMSEDFKESHSEEQDIVTEEDIDAVSEVEAELQDEDFVEYQDFLDDQVEADEELLKTLAQEDDI